MVTEVNPSDKTEMQSSFSQNYLANLDTDDSRYAHRSRKARKVSAALEDYLGSHFSDFTCLDIGCATGTISEHLAQRFRHVTGIDLEAELLQEAQTGAYPHGQLAPLDYALADGSLLPFVDGAFDVVICAQVYEHAANPQRLAQEVWRVLRPGGVCFFSGPNKYALVEEHYWLPFLSWLPQPLADRYMRLCNRGKVYDIGPLSYWGLHNLWRGFRITDYSVPMIREPERFALDDQVGKHPWLKDVPPALLHTIMPLIVPNFNWILEKPG